jgi:hypothetical protein
MSGTQAVRCCRHLTKRSLLPVLVQPAAALPATPSLAAPAALPATPLPATLPAASLPATPKVSSALQLALRG